MGMSSFRFSTKGGGRQAKIKNQVYNGVGRRHAPTSSKMKKAKQQAKRLAKRNKIQAEASPTDGFVSSSETNLSQQKDAEKSEAERPRVAVIGGGAAGLASLRYLIAHGCDAILFEREADIGGVWRYHTKRGIEASDTSSLPVLSKAYDSAPGCRSGVSPMYRDLVCNLPKEIMSFLDLPFQEELPSFVHHEDVCEYLSEYVRYHNLASDGRIRVNTTVRSASPIFSDVSALQEETHIREFLGWQVDSVSHAKKGDEHAGAEISRHQFDHLVVANGHYGVPDPWPAREGVPGISNFSGTIMHSCEYDKRQCFSGTKVLLVGAKASGTDLAREISHAAEMVYVCDRNYPGKQVWHKEMSKGGGKLDDEVKGEVFIGDNDRILVPPDPNFSSNVPGTKQAPIVWCPALEAFEPGSVADSGGFRLRDGSFILSEEVDIVIFATGYQYSFPFLPTTICDASDDHQPEEMKMTVGLSARQHCVDRLFAHMFYRDDSHGQFGLPNLYFIGLPYSVVPFQLFELQAWWAARRIVGMHASDDESSNSSLMLLESKFSTTSGDPHAHLLGDQQWDYCSALLDQVHPPGLSMSEAVDEMPCHTPAQTDSRTGKFVFLLAYDGTCEGQFGKTIEHAEPPRLARIAGGNCDPGHVNVVIYVPVPEDQGPVHGSDIKSVTYVPKLAGIGTSIQTEMCKGGRRDHFTPEERSAIVSIPETHIAAEIAPFDLSRKGRIDPSRLPALRSTNLCRMPKKSKSRPLPTRAHAEARIRLARDIHAVVSKHRPEMPGAPDTYRKLNFSKFPSVKETKSGFPSKGAKGLEKKVSILLQKLVALRRETPRSPSMREWEQCLRGIKKCECYFFS